MMGSRKCLRCFLSQRWLSTSFPKDIPRFGYEFSSYISSDVDSSISERSLTSGTKLFYGSSTQCKAQFERLSEIATIDEIDLTPMVLGCSLPSSSSSNPNEIIKSITDVMFDRPLDFVTTSLNGHSLITLQTLKLQHPTPLLGLELNTPLLLSTTSSSTIIEQVSSLRNQNLLDILVLSSNPYTNSIIKPVHTWAKSNGIITIANDIFRGHPKSPGLFLSPSVSRQRKSTINSIPIEEALEQFRKCLDSCIQMEKTYVEKLPKKSPQDLELLRPIFLGYTLANSQHQILFMEEWDYIRDHQILPKYGKAIKEFEKQSTESEDFVRLYVPLRRNLIRTFEIVLAARQEALINDAHQHALQALTSLIKDGKNSFSNSPCHENILKSWKLIGFDYVLSTGVEVLGDRWEKDMSMTTTPEQLISDQRIAERYLEKVLGSIRDHI